MHRPSRLVAGFLVAAIVLAACLPGAAWLTAVFEVGWVLLSELVPLAPCPVITPSSEQVVPLLSLVSPRGPPSDPLA
jgi:hypothetical protein